MKALATNALTLVFLVLTLLCVGGQMIAGYALEKSEVSDHDGPVPTFMEYVSSSSFGVDLLENWQSEFMQFSMFIALTVWLVQRGSAESKSPGDAGRPAAAGSGWLRRHSLLVVMTTCFLATWAGQSLTGWRAFNEEQSLHGQAAIAWGSYLGESEFWARTLQNWQSEFLAVAAMAIFTVYLREAGSPESKRVETADADNEPTY
ncbi:MAG: hypothetical protein JWM90_1156 [Thermoleophilia bacterium]|nr:hypothetical protein [Thermoleophilia bacterium]